MNRRSFFKSMVGGIATAAAVRAFPFRVFSFPSEVKIAPPVSISFIRQYDILQNRVVSRWDMMAGFAKLDTFSKLETLPVDGEVINVKCWDAEERKLTFKIPGRSEHPFTGIVTG